MRDYNVGNFSMKEKSVKNEFTRKGMYALCEVVDGNSYPEVKIANSIMYANILKISDNHSELEDFSSHLKRNTEVIPCAKLEPCNTPYKLKRAIEKINRRHNN